MTIAIFLAAYVTVGASCAYAFLAAWGAIGRLWSLTQRTS